MSVTVADIINWTRAVGLDDEDAPYLWSDAELIHLLNRAWNDLFKSVLLVKDQTTEAIVEIKLLSNVGVYALDSRIIQVTNGRLETNTNYNPLMIDTERNLNATIGDWRSKTGTPKRIVPGYASGYLSVYPKFDDTYEIVGSSDLSFVAATKTISQSGGDFSIYEEGDEICVSGTDDNDGYFTVATEGTESIVVSEALTNESNTSATISKVEDTLLMTVNRLATARFTVADIAAATVITDIRDDHCDGLTDGIAQYAFLKPDSYTYYPQKAAYHKAQFAEFKKDVRRDMILLHKPDKTRTIRSGTGIGY